VKERKNDEYFHYALNLLKKRVYTSWEIAEKLRRRGASDEKKEDVLRRLEGKGFIDDRKYSEMYVYDSFTLKKWGKWKIRQQLRKKGVNDEIIEESIAKVIEEVDVKKIIVELINKRIKNGKTSKQEIQNVKRFLMNRGFDIGEIDDAIGKLREM